MVLNSDRAWWIDEAKLNRLVSAYKLYMTDDQACFYTGITKDQLEYFQKLHPEFYGIKHACKQKPGISARVNIIEKLKTDSSLAQWWLTVTEKETFSPRVENTGANGRDLFDGMTEKYRKLTEDIENEYTDKKEHSAGSSTGDTDAQPGGDGHAASSTGNTPEKEKTTA